MRKIRLFYNPAAGRPSNWNTKELAETTSVFEKAGIEVSVRSLSQPSESSAAIKKAVDDRCDSVFACGGDGTIHSLIQGIVGTDVTLGIIPMGTANALAHDIKIPISSPRAAALAVLKGEKRRISVGRIEYRDFDGETTSKYFMIAAGIGMDAAMLSGIHARSKERFGMCAYYVAAWRSWLLHQMNSFCAECDGQSEKYQLTQLLAVRIRNFGSLLRNLAPGASLERDDFRIVMSKTKSRLSYLAYVLRGIVGADWSIPGFETKFSSTVSATLEYCDIEKRSPTIFVQADGELLGTLPAKISIVPDALTLLIPNLSANS
jgi:diacylglycerol kinase (ATP)